jgi:hypothetical protein
MWLKRGSRGDVVRELQKKLDELGYDVGSADGVFGERTESAVIDFQIDEGLTVDGIVGPETLDALGLNEELPETWHELTKEEKLRLTGVVSKFEGNFWSCNRDFEFEGYWDKPKRDDEGNKIPPSERKDYTDWKPSGWSKYGSDPGHVGLSYGFIQFTQDGGNLGRLLRAMRERDEEKFDRIFGSDAEELVRVTNLPGEKTKVSDASSPTGYARRSPRVQPVGGVDIWEEPWVSRFVEAGHEEVFQTVQLEMAVSLYFDPMLKVAEEYEVCSEKGLCILMDRCVQMGRGGCKKLLGKHIADKSEWSEDKRFNYLYAKVKKYSWAHRVRKIMESNDLSWQKKFRL